jgi:hypothetical protein
MSYAAARPRPRRRPCRRTRTHGAAGVLSGPQPLPSAATSEGCTCLLLRLARMPGLRGRRQRVPRLRKVVSKRFRVRPWVRPLDPTAATAATAATTTTAAASRPAGSGGGRNDAWMTPRCRPAHPRLRSRRRPHSSPGLGVSLRPPLGPAGDAVYALLPGRQRRLALLVLGIGLRRLPLAGFGFRRRFLDLDVGAAAVAQVRVVAAVGVPAGGAALARTPVCRGGAAAGGGYGGRNRMAGGTGWCRHG